MYYIFMNEKNPLSRYVNAEIRNINEVKNVMENSLIFQYLSFFSIKNSESHKKNFKNSFYNKISKSNFYGDEQLNQVLKNFSQEKWNVFIEQDKVKQFNLNQTDFNEVMIVNKYIEKIFFSYTTTFGNTEIYPNDEKGSEVYDFFSDIDYWMDNNYLNYSFGSDLYAKILFESLGAPNNKDYPKEGQDNYDNYKYNPFMWIYEMIFFSGKNDFLTDSQILSTSLLPLGNYRIFALDEENKIVKTKRPFNIYLNYSIFLLFGISCVLISYYGFNKKIYTKAGEE
ncbi:hypothetical protein [Spiroplasma floricola]|uniref:ABC transporter permease n=1 Tax=Spiroplasma floricola 23-6 TaxID=1336749 RepID=A0A2K8SCR1_9MOLU|nr:hypothetical protein [Spiroplasma floricola]AUB31249.1 ABC transporter permease [Spiroplasma floricola 23-6]